MAAQASEATEASQEEGRYSVIGLRAAMRKNGSSTEVRSVFRRAKACLTSASAQKHKAGLELLKQAASLGHVGAHEWLGAAYDYGLGTRPNRRRAFEHYLTAAKSVCG